MPPFERLADGEGFRAISRLYRPALTWFVRFARHESRLRWPAMERPVTLLAMRFRLIDRVLECDTERAVALKNVSIAEEYLGDHFPGFPVLPGVFMIEAMVQAAREVLDRRGLRRFVLGGVRALRYGSFVRPGEALRVEVTLERTEPDGSVLFKGTGWVVRSASTTAPDSASGNVSETAVSGRFRMRPLEGSSLAAVAGGASG